MDDHVSSGKMPLDGLSGSHGDLLRALEGEVAGHTEGDVGEVIGAGAASAQAIDGEHAWDGGQVVNQIAAQLVLGLRLVAGGVGGRRCVEQRVNGVPCEPPTDAQDDAGDQNCGDGVGVLQPGEPEALAGQGGRKAEHDGQRSPHVGGEMDGVGGQRVGAGLAGDAAERARASEIDCDGDEQHGERPDRGSQVVMVVEGRNHAANSLGDNPDAGGEHDAGFDEGGERFDLAVAVVVVLIGRLVGNLDGEQRDDGGKQVDGRMGRFGQHAQRAGEDAGEELEQRNHTGSEHGEDCSRAFSRMRRAGSGFVHGRGAH